MTTCRSCGAEIVWAQGPSGKQIPLDAKTEKRFVSRYTENPPMAVIMVDTYQSHFATCPDADKWRKE